MGDTGIQLTVELEKRGPAAAIVLTDDQVAALGSTKTPAVRFHDQRGDRRGARRPHGR